MNPEPTEIQARVMAFEDRFVVNRQEGHCVDWMGARRDDFTGFCQYLRDRQYLRAFLKDQASL